MSLMSLIPFSTPKVRAYKRIGPHNFNILSILIGSMLGDCFAEKHGNGTRFCLQQEHSNNAYLLWFHNYVAELGYCTPTIPKLGSRLVGEGKIRRLSRFKTYTFSSFDWIHEAFYVNGVKIVPPMIADYLSPLALAVWIMDDGCAASSGLKIASNSFSKADVQILCNILKEKYGLNATVNKAGVIWPPQAEQYCIYISKYSMPTLASIVRPYMHPSMYYKLNSYL